MKKYQLFFVATLVALCTVQMHTKLREDRAELLVKHLELMRELKTTLVAKYEATNKSIEQDLSAAATDAHLNFSELKKVVDKEWEEFFVAHFDLVNTILERERAYTDEYYVFYHAQRKELRILQDFLREIYEYFQVTQSLNNFHFLRFWKDKPLSVDANTFIDESNKKGPWNDQDRDKASLLLSVNLSLFGNCTAISGSCCTFDYFMSSYSMLDIDIRGIVEDVFNTFKFDKKYVDQLIDLNKINETKEGSLFQIFIPKKMVDRCAYLSYALGHPYDKGIPQSDFDQSNKRHRSISKVLDLYRKGPRLIKDFEKYSTTQNMSVSDIVYDIDRLQARLVFSRDMLLSPSSGIKIYRYTTVSEKDMTNYIEALKKITHQIFVDWLQAQNTCDTIQGTKLESLVHTIQEN